MADAVGKTEETRNAATTPARHATAAAEALAQQKVSAGSFFVRAAAVLGASSARARMKSKAKAGSLRRIAPSPAAAPPKEPAPAVPMPAPNVLAVHDIWPLDEVSDPVEGEEDVPDIVDDECDHTTVKGAAGEQSARAVERG